MKSSHVCGNQTSLVSPRQGHVENAFGSSLLQTAITTSAELEIEMRTSMWHSAFRVSRSLTRYVLTGVIVKGITSKIDKRQCLSVSDSHSLLGMTRVVPGPLSGHMKSKDENDDRSLSRQVERRRGGGM